MYWIEATEAQEDKFKKRFPAGDCIPTIVGDHKAGKHKEEIDHQIAVAKKLNVEGRFIPGRQMVKDDHKGSNAAQGLQRGKKIAATGGISLIH